MLSSFFQNLICVCWYQIKTKQQIPLKEIVSYIPKLFFYQQRGFTH